MAVVTEGPEYDPETGKVREFGWRMREFYETSSFGGALPTPAEMNAYERAHPDDGDE